MRTEFLFKALLLTFLFCSFSTLHSEGKQGIRIQKKSKIVRMKAPMDQEFDLENVKLLAQKRNGLIQDIKKFLREAKDNEQKAELNLRLGALYMEDYHAELAIAQSNYQKQVEQNVKNPKMDETTAKASLTRALQLYKDLANKHKRHPRRDEMIFLLAQASLDLSETKSAIRYFNELVAMYPNSKYSKDAFVQLGDYYFENNQFTKASPFYDKVLGLKNKQLHAYAMYKKAWCEYNAQKYKAALDHFKWVIDNEEKLEGAASRVKNEALKDIALIFVELKLTDEAIQFYKSQGDAHLRVGLESLAGLHYEKGNYKDALILYDQLLALDSNHAKNPGYELSAIEALKLANHEDKAIQRLFQKLPLYTKDSNWYEIHSNNPKTVSEAVTGFEQLARKYAIEMHHLAQKTKNDRLYGATRLLYEKYLEYFAHEGEATQIRFYLAEVLYKQNEYVDASKHYFQVYKESKNAGLKEKAIQYCLMALDLQLNIERKKEGLGALNSKLTAKIKAKDDEKLEETPFSSVEESFLAVGQEFIQNYPQAKETPDVLYESAYLQYQHHYWKQALTHFAKTLQKYSKHPTAIPSAYLTLDILNREKDYNALIAAAKKFIAQPDLQKPQFTADVSDILRKAELKRIQIAEQEGKFKEAADHYMDYTRLYGPQDESLYEKALYNASINYTKAELIVFALEAQEKFLRRFPKSSFRKNMLLQVAKSHEALANLEKAAEYFDVFFKDYSNDPQAKNALKLASVYYAGASHFKKAESGFLTYLRMYPKEHLDIEKDLVELYESQGATDQLSQYYLHARANKGIPLSLYLSYTLKLLDIYRENAQARSKLFEEAYRVSQKFQKELKETPRGVEALAKLSMLAMGGKERAFYSIDLRGKNLEASLKRKLAYLKELERDYNSIASLGSGEQGITAIFRTAKAYYHTAVAIKNAPVPSELSAEQLDLYHNELDKQMIQPFVDKAKNLSASCLEKAQELSIFADSIASCYEIAALLNSERYPKARSFYLPSFRTALFVPEEKESKMELGRVKHYAYPFYSSSLFEQPREIASIQPTSDDLLSPKLVHYGPLSTERKSILKSAYESEKPDDPKDPTTFAFLNVARVLTPPRAIQLISQNITKESTNFALHNLLALAYLENGNPQMAKALLLSILARGYRNPAVWNNLGVLSMLQNKEQSAIEYFQEAVKTGNSKEALSNLGFIALKYRNGEEARKLFEKALQIEKEDASSRLGFATAALQSRDFEGAKDELGRLADKFRNDPYTHLAWTYYLMDLEKNYPLAKKTIQDFMSRKNVENDRVFREALKEAEQGAALQSDSNLPTIE